MDKTLHTFYVRIGELDQLQQSRADIQLIRCENQQKTSWNCQHIVLHKEIEVKESNAGVRIFTESS